MPGPIELACPGLWGRGNADGGRHRSLVVAMLRGGDDGPTRVAISARYAPKRPDGKKSGLFASSWQILQQRTGTSTSQHRGFVGRRTRQAVPRRLSSPLQPCSFSPRLEPINKDSGTSGSIDRPAMGGAERPIETDRSSSGRGGRKGKKGVGAGPRHVSSDPLCRPRPPSGPQ